MTSDQQDALVENETRVVDSCRSTGSPAWLQLTRTKVAGIQVWRVLVRDTKTRKPIVIELTNQEAAVDLFHLLDASLANVVALDSDSQGRE